MTNIITFDIAKGLYDKNIPFFPSVFKKITRLIYSCEIPYTADIDPSVTFPHKGLGVVIGHDTVIGANTKVLQNVTIGGRSNIRANPIIGKNVLIGANACILGPITVGDNAQIGAHSVVLHDVPPNAVVIGNPARVIKIVK